MGEPLEQPESNPAASREAPTERRVFERVRPTRPGDTVYRVKRAEFEGFTRRGTGHLEAGLTIERPAGPLGWLWRLLVGNPIHNELESQERLSKKKALAVFSSDALSSVAYVPQEVLAVLLTGGMGALWWSFPIAIGVVLLLACVVTSYRQTISAYPSGGGSYIVAHANLGPVPGLVAASALSVGYILTVSVSIASAVDQMVSTAPGLVDHRVLLGIAAIAIVTVTNLRGIRESGSIFSVPTYVFLAVMYSLIGVGLIRLFMGTLEVAAPTALPDATAVTGGASIFLLLRAFATGSAVMTGTEAISDGVPAFQPPEPRNAARTLVAMGAILASMYLGLTFILTHIGTVPTEHDTIISQLAKLVFGDGLLYYVVQAATILILILAANTAYADFPRLASFLARDNYAPHQLAFRAERLAFSNGIILLGVLSALLIVAFGGSTGALLPLYALSVFLAFTLSQAGMVAHWRRVRGPQWQVKAAVNGAGALVTGMVTLIAGATNFMNPNLPIVPGLPVGWGAWLVVIIIPAMIKMFLTVKAHYADAGAATALPSAPEAPRSLKNVVVVPVAVLNRPSIRALQYATSISSQVTAVHVTSEAARAADLEREWQLWGQGVPLVVIESPYRSLTGPLLQFLSEMKRVEQADIVTVVLPEYVPDHWWQHFLHGQSAQFLKLSLLFKPNFVVVSVPYNG
ncbi:MAG: APC family permease [Dehalococcoidia bacterium]|nr:APC family permease [Dehalococcoidia bacterium]